ncbi:hypothetical protein LINPERPRIM_LOCUS15444 [Linum perenne]
MKHQKTIPSTLLNRENSDRKNQTKNTTTRLNSTPRLITTKHKPLNSIKTRKDANGDREIGGKNHTLPDESGGEKWNSDSVCFAGIEGRLMEVPELEAETGVVESRKSWTSLLRAITKREIVYSRYGAP